MKKTNINKTYRPRRRHRHKYTKYNMLRLDNVYM